MYEAFLAIFIEMVAFGNLKNAWSLFLGVFYALTTAETILSCQICLA